MKPVSLPGVSGHSFSRSEAKRLAALLSAVQNTRQWVILFEPTFLLQYGSVLSMKVWVLPWENPIIVPGGGHNRSAAGLWAGAIVIMAASREAIRIGFGSGCRQLH